jgi:hypothetical protein
MIAIIEKKKKHVGEIYTCSFAKEKIKGRRKIARI